MGISCISVYRKLQLESNKLKWCLGIYSTVNKKRQIWTKFCIRINPKHYNNLLIPCQRPQSLCIKAEMLWVSRSLTCIHFLGNKTLLSNIFYELRKNLLFKPWSADGLRPPKIYQIGKKVKQSVLWVVTSRLLLRNVSTKCRFSNWCECKFEWWDNDKSKKNQSLKIKKLFRAKPKQRAS